MGFNLKGNIASSKPTKSGFYLEKNKVTYLPLSIGDKNFGTVSYGAYRAVENNTLDSYAPINEEEKSVLEAYKKQAESYAFKTKYGDTIMSRIIQDGDKSIVVPGYYDGAILSQEQAEQRYKATGEHFGKFNTSDEAISYANRLNTGGLSALGVRKAKEIEPPKVTDYAKYAAGRAAGGFTGALIKPVELAGIAGNKTASFITSLGGLMPNKVSKFYDQEVKDILNKEWALTEQYHNNMDLHEHRYALESDKKNFVGGLAESAGSVAGVFAFGGLGKFGSAANGANAAKNMTTTALKAQANATKLTKSMNMAKNGLKSFFTPQDVLFGSTAAMSSAQEAYERTGNVNKSITYGLSSGMLEIATEKMFGGFAGTGIGDSVIKFATKYPVLDKILDVTGEAIEEGAVSLIDPFLRSATGIEDKIDMPSGKEIGLSMLSGVLLSGIMGAATYPVKKSEYKKTAEALNSTLEAIKIAMPDADVPEALNVNKANEKTIKERQETIKKLGEEYKSRVEKFENATEEMLAEYRVQMREYQKSIVSESQINSETDSAKKATLQALRTAQLDYAADMQQTIDDLESVLTSGADKATVNRLFGVQTDESFVPTYIDEMSGELVSVQKNQDGSFTVKNAYGSAWNKNAETFEVRYTQLTPEQQSVINPLKNETGSGTIKENDINGVNNNELIREYDGIGEVSGEINAERRLLGQRDQGRNIDSSQNTAGRMGKAYPIDSRKNGGEKAEEGRIKGVYHGSAYRFNRFEKSYVDIGIHFGTKEQAKARIGSSEGNVSEYDLILNNPLYCEDIFGERNPDEYLDDLIENSALKENEKTELREVYENYKQGDIARDAEKSLEEKLVSGKYSIETEIDNDGIFVNISLKDDLGSENQIPLTELIDREILNEMFGEDATSSMISNAEIPNFAKIKLSALVAKKAAQIEVNFLKLRKIENILKSFGYDGVAYQNENEGDGWSYAVFDNEQIKKSSGNMNDVQTMRPKVVEAIKKTMRPEIRTNSEAMAALRERFGNGGLNALAEDIILTVNRDGNIGAHEALFADNGKAIYDALGASRADDEPRFSLFEENSTTEAENQPTTDEATLGNKNGGKTGVDSTDDEISTDNAASEDAKKTESIPDDIDVETKLFHAIVDEVATDETTKGKKGKHYYVSGDTPEIIIKKAKVDNLPMIISFESLYLAVRERGELEGHYHNLGAENVKKLYNVLSNPKYILRNNKTGRLNIVSDISIGNNPKSIVSIELDEYKNVENNDTVKHRGNYNLIITLFSAKDNYAENLKNNSDVSILYEKKEDISGSDLTAETVPLGNTKEIPSNNTISQNDNIVNSSIRKKSENDTSDTSSVTSGDSFSSRRSLDEPRFSIENVPGTDKKYVRADRKVIKGNDPAKWRKQIFNHINNKIRKGEDVQVIGVDGDVLTITGDTAGKATFRNNIKNPDGTYRKMTDEEFAAKLRAEAHIDELAQASKRGNKIVPDTKNHAFATDGFNYRTAYFEDFDGQYYRLTLSVGKNGEINTVYNIGKLKEIPNPARGSKAAGKSSDIAGWNFSIDNNVPQNDNIVNTNIRENSENDTRESEVNSNEQGRSNSLSADGGWGYNGGAGEQVERVSGYERGNQGKNAAERQDFARELTERGQTEEVVEQIGKYNYKYAVVNPEAYNDDMLSMVEEAKSRGIELGFFVGNAMVNYDSKRNFLINGIKISGSKVLVQYDADLSPQILAKHEIGHAKWLTAEMQKVKNDILNQLSDEDKQKILSQERYRRYIKVYKGNMNAVWEEFVCDVLAGMNDYAVRFESVVNEYWYGENSDVDIYSPAEYTESIDAGGVGFSIFPGGVFPPFNKSHSDANERATRWAHNEDIETGAQRIFFYKEDAYIVEKFDNMDLGYLVVEKLKKKDLEMWEAHQNRKGDKQDGEIKTEYSGSGGIISNNGQNSEFYNEGRRTFDDDNGSDKYSGETAEVQRVDREQDGKWGVESNRSRTDKHSVEDREGEVKFSLAGDNTEFWDEWLNKIEEHGVIPKGENPVRDIAVPKKIDKNRYVSRFARTMLEAGVTPPDMVGEFEKRILDGEMTHEVITNDRAREYAIGRIKELGYDEARASWEVLAREGKIGKKELALGMELYNQAITNKDIPTAMKLAAELAAEATRAGQTLQACKMLKLMSPDGQLYYLEKSVQKMNEEFKAKLGDKFKNIELDEKLMEDFLNATDEESRNAAYDRICQSIADQIPATKLDKWNAWRYLAMLGNPRTHIRNIIGNGVFVPAVRIKNYVGAVMEIAVGVDESERTKSLRKSKAAVEFAKDDFEKMVKVLQGENAKYAVTSDIEGKRTIFKTKWLETLRTKNFDFLEKEDMWFLKLHYIDALARVITARKLDVNNLSTEALETARAYAIKEAQAATYRDANALAEGLNQLQKKIEYSDKKAVRATGVLLEGVMPFKKTPLNIAKQGIQYSPVGILTGVYKGLKRLKSGKAFSSAEIIDELAKGMTGTGIMLIGLFLASIGALNGPGSEDKKKRAFDKMVGEQSYALKIGDKSYTIDWATPMSLPLFTGAELYRLTSDSGFSFGQVVDAIVTLPEPLLELSVFSGISDVIESAQYSEVNPVFAISSDMITSYLLQACPTVGGQLSRIIDDNKREYYYTDKNSGIPRGIQSFIGQASSKIPFASFLFAPSVDEWGREESYGNIIERTLENVASPGYYSDAEYTMVDKELKRLYEETGEASVLPTTQQKYYKENKITYNMSAADYAEVKKMRGQQSFKLLKELIGSKRYKAMSYTEKVKAIKKCYETAGEETKKKMLEKIKRNSKK